MAGTNIFFDTVNGNHQPHMARDPAGILIAMDLLRRKLTAKSLYRTRLDPQLSQMGTSCDLFALHFERTTRLKNCFNPLNPTQNELATIAQELVCLIS